MHMIHPWLLVGLFLLAHLANGEDHAWPSVRLLQAQATEESRECLRDTFWRSTISLHLQGLLRDGLNITGEGIVRFMGAPWASYTFSWCDTVETPWSCEARPGHFSLFRLHTNWTVDIPRKVYGHLGPLAGVRVTGCDGASCNVVGKHMSEVVPMARRIVQMAKSTPGTLSFTDTLLVLETVARAQTELPHVLPMVEVGGGCARAAVVAAATAHTFGESSGGLDAFCDASGVARLKQVAEPFHLSRVLRARHENWVGLSSVGVLIVDPALEFETTIGFMSSGSIGAWVVCGGYALVIGGGRDGSDSVRRAWKALVRQRTWRWIRDGEACVVLQKICSPQNPEGNVEIVLRAQGMEGSAVEGDWMPLIPSPLPLWEDSTRLTVFFVWMTSPETLTPRCHRAIESLLWHHPSARVRVYATELPLDTFQRFASAGYDVAVVRIHLPDLFVGTPVEEWHTSGVWASSPTRITDLSDILRLLLLYKKGGIYLDFDVILVQSLSSLQNSLGSEGVWDGKESFNNAILAFDRGHSFVYACIKEFVSSYSTTERWGHNGPGVLGRVLMRERAHHAIRLLPRHAFYYLSWLDMKETFQSMREEERNRILERIDKTSYVVHLWNRVASRLTAEKGSIAHVLLNRYSLFDLPVDVT